MFEIKMDSGSKVQLNMPQQQWVGDSESEVSLFSGQEMRAVKTTGSYNHYELHYLGFRATGFVGIDAAKACAPEFARKVLDTMACMVRG